MSIVSGKGLMTDKCAADAIVPQPLRASASEDRGKKGESAECAFEKGKI